ncbi:MAG TPA: alpha/beta fold hydrolase [Gaiellaceae bacterium]
MLLAHGSGSGPWIFDDWAETFPGVTVAAPDLQEGLDVAHASMDDFAAAIVRAAERLSHPLAVVGWSLGGLAAMMAAERARPDRLVLLEPSAPAETAGTDPAVPLEHGLLDPEAIYGAFPPGQRARPDSLLARAERKRGISVPSLPCPTLVVYGDELPSIRGAAVAAHYDADSLHAPGAGHWDLVLEQQIRGRVAEWLSLGSDDRRLAEGGTP